MVDVVKLQRFRSRFSDWRGPVVAAAEEPLLTTVTAISSYVDDVADLTTIQHDLVVGSRVFQHFTQLFHSRTYGALLYGKLAIEDYYLQCAEDNNFAENEEEPLTHLLETLRSLYENPRHNPSLRLNELLTYAHAWLDNVNTPLSKTTLFSLYTMLMLIDAKLSHLTFSEKAGLTFLSIDRVQTRREVRALLNKTAGKVAECDHALRRLTTVEVNEVQPVPPTIEAYIDAQCLAILEQQGFTLAEKMEQIKALLVDVQHDIDALLAENARATELHHQVHHTLIILQALNTNEQRVLGKKYAIELIDNNIESFQNLLQHASAAEQEEWGERLDQLELPTFSQQASSASQYALSWATFVPTLAYRALAPKSLIKWVDDHSFSTFDSECKARLKTLAETRVTILHDALVASAAVKEQIANHLTLSNLTVKPQIIAASRDKLSEILATTRDIHQVITDYEALSTRIIQNQEKLHEAQGLGEKVDHFIAMHDGFFVKLSLFLSKIHSLFKTDTAAKVEEVRSIKEALRDLKNQYELAVTDGLQEINNNPVISLQLKDAVVAKLTPTSSPLPEAAQHHPRDIITAFTLVKTTFNRHVAQPLEPLPLVDEGISVDTLPVPSPRT